MNSLASPTERYLRANHLRFRCLELGSGPLVLLCHGWPELAWSWRHQIVPLAAAGFRVVAPDLRGFGGTDAPMDVGAYTMLHLVGDAVGLVHALGEQQAIIVGHDWGAALAWNAALMRPDVFRAVAGLSVPYAPRGRMSLLDLARKSGAHRFYMLYFQEPGVAESVLEADPYESLLRLMYLGSGEFPYRGEGWPWVVPEGRTLLEASPRPQQALPWLSEAELRLYADAYRQSGFRGGLNWYRCMDRTWELMAPWNDMPIPVPALYIGGEHDAVLRIPGLNTAIAEHRRNLPLLQHSEVIPKIGHWTQQEAPERVSELLLRFVRSLS
jgi:pimeloyl-ACP methyl ester carboxylesterase